jgi:putative transposase
MAAVPRRKRCKRFDIPSDAHFLTFSCFRRMPLLSRERSCRWFLDGVQLGREREMYDLWAYVIMPEHVHLVLRPHGRVRICEILRTIKQSTAKRALVWIKAHEPTFLTRLEHRRIDGSVSYHFWQRGGGYDRNLRSVADVHEKIHYVHNNPVRRGLVEKASLWQWSSCRAWETGKDEPMAIDRGSMPRLVETGG